MTQSVGYTGSQVSKGRKGQLVAYLNTDGSTGYGVVMVLHSDWAKVGVCHKTFQLTYRRTFDAVYAVPYSSVVETISVSELRNRLTQ